MVWYSHLLKNFPQFVVIHTVKGFGVVNKEVDVFLELSCFFDDPVGVIPPPQAPLPWVLPSLFAAFNVVLLVIFSGLFFAFP